MKWGDNARDFDTALAVWPHYRPLFDNWLMQELVEQGDKAPVWRDRRVPTENGRVRSDVYPDRETALSAAATLNQTLHDALAAREMYAGRKRSLQLKVAKNLQSKERLREEEELMLAEARRRHANDPRPDPSAIVLPAELAPFRQELSEHLSDMPYLRVVIVTVPETDRSWHRSILYLSHDNKWSKPYIAGERSAAKAMRARIANGFGYSADDHWGKTKAKIRQILLPRANQLLQRTASSSGTKKMAASVGRSNRTRPPKSTREAPCGRKAPSARPTTADWSFCPISRKAASRCAGTPGTDRMTAEPNHGTPIITSISPSHNSMVTS